jgi:hypothetical protein
VVTLRGQPAPGAKITVLKTGVGEFRKFAAESDGTQRLLGLPPALYNISVTYEDALPYEGKVVVDSREERVATINLKMAGRIYGTVMDRSGRPVADARVFLVDMEKGGPAPYEAVQTDPQGHYAIRGVGPGLFQVRFRHALFQPLDHSDVRTRGADDFQQVDVVLSLGVRLSGRVVDEAGRPVEGAKLVAGNGTSAGTATSAADGSFTVSGLTDVPANLSAERPGYGSALLRNVPGNSNGLVLRLPKPGTLFGRLQIDAIPKKTQIVLSRFDDELRQVIPADVRYPTVATDGTFLLPDLVPGTYWIDVQADGYEAVGRPQAVVVAGQETSEVTISMRKKN